jgi:hypothetical protein
MACTKHAYFAKSKIDPTWTQSGDHENSLPFHTFKRCEKKSQPKAKQYSLYCWGKLACEHGKRGKKRFRKRIVFLLFFDQKAFAEPDLSRS